MRRLLLLVFLSPLFMAGPVAAEGFFLEPPRIGTGGVTQLHWVGETPFMALVRYRDTVLRFWPDAHGASLLLGADLEQEEGIYPLLLVAVDRLGKASFSRLELTVEQVERPQEALILPKSMVHPDAAARKRIAQERTQLKELYARSLRPPQATSLQLPLQAEVSSPFGLGRILNGVQRSPHAGIDFRAASGTLIKAAAAGDVLLVDDLYYTGRTILLDHGQGLLTLYAHLSSSRVTEGETVKIGAPIGRVGNSGRSTGAHLHWGVRLRGDRIDPLGLTAPK
ncbi:MAG: hypothetical protein C0621_03425 [Desulfuromonas sp.]|nr:MAG: hypothetical protein C0621_03425 [Desulfuromonas sp.]